MLGKQKIGNHNTSLVYCEIYLIILKYKHVYLYFSKLSIYKLISHGTLHGIILVIDLQTSLPKRTGDLIIFIVSVVVQ